MIRYRETGGPQSHMLPQAASGGWSVTFYTLTGQRERALAAMEILLQEGVFTGLARAHVGGAGRFLGDDPRYQALLEEAGITW